MEHCPNDPMPVLGPPAAFRKLSEVANMALSTVLDVMGVVQSVQPVNNIQRKDGTTTEKRSITLRDDSGFEVELSMWSPYATRDGDRLEAVRARATPLPSLRPHRPLTRPLPRPAGAEPGRAPRAGLQARAADRVPGPQPEHGGQLRV